MVDRAASAIDHAFGLYAVGVLVLVLLGLLVYTAVARRNGVTRYKVELKLIMLGLHIKVEQEFKENCAPQQGGPQLKTRARRELDKSKTRRTKEKGR